MNIGDTHHYSFILKELIELKKINIEPKKSPNKLFYLYSLPAFDNNKQPEILLGINIKSNKYLVFDDTILFSKLNLKFKRVWKINRNTENNSICSTEFLPIKIKSNNKNINFDFLYYFLISNDFINKLEKQACGTSSSHQRIKVDSIFSEIVNLPPFLEQKQIATILSSLDDKIELNYQINKNLEEIAQAIFKHWFIDFEFPDENGEPYKFSGGEMLDSELGLIPEGWKIEKLGNLLSEIVTGNRPKGGVRKYKEGIPSIGAESINGLCNYDFSKTKYIPESYFRNMKKGVVKNGDILLYKDGAKIGRKSMFLEDFPFKRCCINSHVFILRSNSSMRQSYLFFYLDQEFMTKNIINLNTNSAQPGINSTSIKTLKILLPSDKILDLFSKLVFPILRIIFNNAKENKCLSNLRDALLPKLMSGEIRVPINNIKEGE